MSEAGEAGTAGGDGGSDAVTVGGGGAPSGGAAGSVSQSDAGSAPVDISAGAAGDAGAVGAGGDAGSNGGCDDEGDCNGATPVCDRETHSCISRPSCKGLASTCGASSDADCCNSSTVPGGSFLRGFDGGKYADNSYPATVSSFRLDTYEITVGRFRKFVAAYKQNMIAPGAGKNANNPDDPGWDSSWNVYLDADSTALVAVIAPVHNSTWLAGNDNLPIIGLNWYEAEAFCIWDGGRLPTEAEWNYAASGGAEQRVFPWGNSAPGPDTARAVYDCRYKGSGVCNGSSDLAPVGSSPSGNGKWGQSDLAGNVMEWVQDGFAQTYPMPCTNCSAPSRSRSMLRGGRYDMDADGIKSSARTYDLSNTNFYGARCVH